MKIENYGCSFEVEETPQYLNFWKNHFSRDWETDTFHFLSKYLAPDKVLIDIGAWIGPISLPASQAVGKCICFEPDVVAYGEFKSNIELNGYTNIILENKAVSIHESIRLGANVLGESITSDNCTANQFEASCITVRDIFNKYNLSESDICAIKIDIEGHEAELLQDEFLMELNVPMHISLHFEFAQDKNLFLQKISKFLHRKNIGLHTLDLNRNIAIEVL